jgi:hypothetical protein
LPTKFGQNLIVEKNPENSLEKFDADGQIWFEDSISFSEIKIPLLQKTETIKATLISILHQGYLLNPDFINE